jgi:hypothetical protein
MRSGFQDIQGFREDIRTGFQALSDQIRGKAEKAGGKIGFSPLPPPVVSDIRFAEKRTDSPDRSSPYAIQVIIQTTTSIQPAAFRIECTETISAVQFFVAGQGVMMSKTWRTDGNVAYLSFGFPPLTPESPLVVILASKADIRVKKVDRLRQ